MVSLFQAKPNVKSDQAGLFNESPGSATPLRGALAACVLLAGLYIALLFYTDQTNGVFKRLPNLAAVLPLVCLCSLVSYVVRYQRWRWLLARTAAAPFPWFLGFLAYIAGFALTASPGKVGELIRIRYFQQLGVPSDRVVTGFLVERLADLVTLLVLALPLAAIVPGFAAGLALVGIAPAVVCLATVVPRLRVYPVFVLRRLGWRGPARLAAALASGLAGVAACVTPGTVAGTLGFGVAAWLIQAMGLVILLPELGVIQPVLQTLPIMPAAMLVGAASMLPGGVGSTEAAIVAILAVLGVPASAAILAAVGGRIGSLWFAMTVGIIACLVLDRPGRAKVH